MSKADAHVPNRFAKRERVSKDAAGAAPRWEGGSTALQLGEMSNR